MEDLVARYGFLCVTILQQALLGLSLYFPLMAGQLSLASIGFYSLGGYVAAIMGTHPDLAPLRESLGFFMYPLEWLVALVVSTVLGVALGYPALRLRGIYLALATIAFVQVFAVAVLTLPIAGGAIGIFDIPQPFEGRLAYAWFFGPLLLLTLAWLGARQSSPFTGAGVVTKAGGTRMLSGPGANFKTYASAPEGRIVKILDTGDEAYYEIGLPAEGIKGWALKTDVEKL